MSRWAIVVDIHGGRCCSEVEAAGKLSDDEWSVTVCNQAPEATRQLLPGHVDDKGQSRDMLRGWTNTTFTPAAEQCLISKMNLSYSQMLKRLLSICLC